MHRVKRERAGRGATVVAKWRSLDAFGKFISVVGVLLVVQCGYSTIAWLLSSHPAGALVPGVFLFFGSSLLGRWKHPNGYDATRRAMASSVITGAASAVSIVILWTLAEKRDDAVYHGQAVTMSIWGGATVVLAVLILLVFATPRGRQRMRTQWSAGGNGSTAALGRTRGE
jgi:O-antigen/teichoic acid export membrane protein